MPARPPVPPLSAQHPGGAGAPRQAPVGWPRLASRLRVRHRFAALGVVGVLMCALPLLQVLRYQGEAIDLARAAQAALDPLALAVDVQRGLLQHRDVAGAVLRGAAAREPERRQRQRVVNERLTDLELALRGYSHPRAAQEGLALRTDWTEVSRRVEERSLAAPDSDAAHRLLVEQALQVIDYVSLAALDLGGRAGPEASAWLQPVLHDLPRLSARLGLLASAPAGSAEAHPREFAAVQRRLAQVLAELQTLPAPAGNATHATHAIKATDTTDTTQPADATPSRDLAQALAGMQQRAQHYFDLQRSGALPTPVREAARALSEAEAALYRQAHAHLGAALADHAQALGWQRQALLTSLALLAVLGTALGLSLMPPPGPRRGTPGPARHRFNAADPAAPDSRPAEGDAPAGPPGRLEARRLLHRLRDPAAPAPRPAQDTGHPHTLPPDH